MKGVQYPGVPLFFAYLVDGKVFRLRIWRVMERFGAVFAAGSWGAPSDRKGWGFQLDSSMRVSAIVPRDEGGDGGGFGRRIMGVTAVVSAIFHWLIPGGH